MNAISYSNVNTYQRCPKKAFFRDKMGIQPKRKSTNLWKGIEAHEVLKDTLVAMQKGVALQEAFDDAVSAALARANEAKQYMFENELLDVDKELDDIFYLAEKFLFEYMPEDWEILHVEETFYITVDGEIISFTPDLIIRDRNGYVWVVDHKTTSAVPEGGVPFGDTQALLYYTGVKSMYPETSGFIFSRMRKKRPTEPRLTKTGTTRVADLNRIDTTYEILRDFLQEKAPGLLNDGMHKRRLAELRDGPDKFFWRDTVYVNEHTEQAILDDVSYVVSQYKQSEKTGKWPRSLREDRSYNSCSRCPYSQLCSADLLGWDTTSLIEEHYEPADPKNPYEGVLYGED